MHSARAAHQTRLALTPLGVETLDSIGKAGPFIARMVVLLGKETSGGTQMVAEDRLVPIVGGHVGPAQFEHRIGSVSNHKADDLTDQARDCGPEPQARRNANAQLVYFDGVLVR